MKAGKLETHEELRNDGGKDYTAYQVRKAHGNLDGAYHVVATYDNEADAEAHVQAVLDARYGVQEPAEEVKEAPKPKAKKKPAPKKKAAAKK